MATIKFEKLRLKHIASIYIHEGENNTIILDVCDKQGSNSRHIINKPSKLRIEHKPRLFENKTLTKTTINTQTNCFIYGNIEVATSNNLIECDGNISSSTSRLFVDNVVNIDSKLNNRRASVLSIEGPINKIKVDSISDMKCDIVGYNNYDTVIADYIGCKGNITVANSKKYCRCILNKRRLTS